MKKRNDTCCGVFFLEVSGTTSNSGHRRDLRTSKITISECFLVVNSFFSSLSTYFLSGGPANNAQDSQVLIQRFCLFFAIPAPAAPTKAPMMIHLRGPTRNLVSHWDTMAHGNRIYGTCRKKCPIPLNMERAFQPANWTKLLAILYLASLPPPSLGCHRKNTSNRHHLLRYAMKSWSRG